MEKGNKRKNTKKKIEEIIREETLNKTKLRLIKNDKYGRKST